MLNKIAILGAGFIGLNLVNSFLRSGHDVKVLDRGEQPADLTHPQLKWIKGEVGDEVCLSSALQDVDVVFYLVSSTVPGDNVDVSKELFVNVGQLLKSLELCDSFGVKRFIFFSSSSVYGTQTIVPTAEASVPLPISAHGIQKLTMEYYINLFSRQSKVECKIVRLSNPFGPGQNIYGRQGFISIVIGHLKDGSPVNIRGTGLDVRDYIYIDDVVESCHKLITSESRSIVFNIGCGQGASLNDVIVAFESLLGRSLNVNHIECRASDIPISILDVTKAKNELEFSPKTSLIEGIKTFLKHHELYSDE